MSKVAVVYWSSTGNTEAMAEAVGAGIAKAGKEADVVEVSSASMEDLKAAKVFALGCPAMGAEVLEEIVKAVDGSMKIFVDGGLRNGVDIFKALALGADAVIVARPFVNAIYGAKEEGIQVLVDKLGS